ncbi:MFS transporter [Candidatus Kapaibacterium sp.]
MSSKREQIAWYIYDWAVSAFTTTVTTVFLGPYLTAIAENAAVDGYLNIFGINVFSGSFFSYCVSLSVILQVVLLPYFGALADYTKHKKFMMGFFAYAGALSTMCLYFLEGNNYLLGGILLLLANISFGSSMVFYNAFLSEISTPEERDNVSSNGFAIGYLGGGILLLLNLILVMKAETFKLSTGHAVRISLASAGLWWAIFSLFPLIYLRKSKSTNKLPNNTNILTFGFRQIVSTIKESKKYPLTIAFLLAYLFYNDGVQSIIVLAAQFGQEEIKLDIGTLTTVILMVQFVAFFGAKLFNYIAIKTTTKKSLMISLFIWLLVVFYAYMFLKDITGFYILGAVIGLVLGGTQALSRSLYSQMIPIGKESEYFSLYEISERGTSWIGPLIFGLSLQFTSSYRIAIASLGIFFIIGLLLLWKVDIDKAIDVVKSSE